MTRLFPVCCLILAIGLVSPVLAQEPPPTSTPFLFGQPPVFEPPPPVFLVEPSPVPTQVPFVPPTPAFFVEPSPTPVPTTAPLFVEPPVPTSPPIIFGSPLPTQAPIEPLITSTPVGLPTLTPTVAPTGSDAEIVPEERRIVTPLRVEVRAPDGLTLVADLWNAELSVQTPAVLLMHEAGRNRRSWDPLIPALVRAGYRVLAVDLRGHGETRGEQDWEAASEDIKVWLEWLRTQPSVLPDAISVVGASIGANLAIVGCATELSCVTAVALSPGLNFFGIQPQTYLVEGMTGRSALLVAAQNDLQSIEAVREMVYTATGEIGAQIYRGQAHGTELLAGEDNQLSSLIVSWLNAHMPDRSGQG